MRTEQQHQGPIVSAGILLGTGLGAFVDGILFHQILQWHNTLSSTHPPIDLVSMKYNMLWDGLFHAFSWAITVAGVTRLWLAGRRPDVAWSSRAFVGALLLGWGLFNAIEGVIDHHVLRVHHVHPGSAQLAWDLAFLASGALMISIGMALTRAGGSGASPRAQTA